MKGRKAARNMLVRNTNKTGIQCVCWFHSLGICHDARSYVLKIHSRTLKNIKNKIIKLQKFSNIPVVMNCGSITKERNIEVSGTDVIEQSICEKKRVA